MCDRFVDFGQATGDCRVGGDWLMGNGWKLWCGIEVLEGMFVVFGEVMSMDV
ncbi:hypothetical protein M3J09_008536 [Ascochyta lentis]